MLTLLSEDNYPVVQQCLKMQLFPIIASVINSQQEGKIFVDDPINPKVIFIIHKCSFAFLYGDVTNYTALFEFLYKEKSIPQYFHIYDTGTAFNEHLKSSHLFNFKLRERMRLKRVDDRLPKKSVDIAEQYELTPADQISATDFDVFELGKYWPSLQDFKENGFGWLVTDNNKAVCICYTASIANNVCETDILTLPEYRGLGLATVVCEKMLATCLERNIEMGWDVFVDNYASIKTIEKFDYEPFYNYLFTSIYKLI